MGYSQKILINLRLPKLQSTCDALDKYIVIQVHEYLSPIGATHQVNGFSVLFWSCAPLVPLKFHLRQRPECRSQQRVYLQSLSWTCGVAGRYPSR